MVKVAVRPERGQEVDGEIPRRSMPRMGDLGGVLEQAVDSLDDGPLAEHHLLPQGQQPVLHVLAHASDQLDALPAKR